MLPVRRMLGFSLAILHWSPDQFWASTPNELYAALDVYNELNDTSGKSRRKRDYRAWYDKEFNS